jgi:hypothetical protein
MEEGKEMYAAKMWAALLGSIVTALLASGIIPVTGPWKAILTIVSVVLTAITTYQVRNSGSDVPKVTNHG